MIVARNGHKWRECQKRFERGGDDVRKESQQFQDGSRSSDNGNRSGKSRSTSVYKPKVVSATAVSQRPSSRTRVLKRREKDHGVRPKCGSRGAIRTSRIVLCLCSLSRRMMVIGGIHG